LSWDSSDMGAAHSIAAPKRVAPITLIFFITFSSLIGTSNYLEATAL
jgi:hypothetical protein